MFHCISLGQLFLLAATESLKLTQETIVPLLPIPGDFPVKMKSDLLESLSLSLIYLIYLSSIYLSIYLSSI